MHLLDLSVFYSIYNLSSQSIWPDRLIVFFGEYLIYILLAILFYFMWDAFRTEQMRKVYGYCVAVAGALIARFGVVEIIRHYYHRPRPFLVLHLPHLLSDTSYSFPSGHTIFLFALATGVLFVNKRFAYFLYAAGLIVGIARVAGGVHYPSDILGGMALGMITGFAVYKMWSNIARSN